MNRHLQSKSHTINFYVNLLLWINFDYKVLKVRPFCHTKLSFSLEQLCGKELKNSPYHPIFSHSSRMPKYLITKQIFFFLWNLKNPFHIIQISRFVKEWSILNRAHPCNKFCQNISKIRSLNTRQHRHTLDGRTDRQGQKMNLNRTI